MVVHSASGVSVLPPIRWLRRNIAVFLAILCLGAAPASAAEDVVTLNFVNADIDAVVKAVSEITGRNFVLDPKIKGTVNIISARPVPKSLVYPTLLSALRLQGVVAIEGNGITKLVLETDAKMHGSDVGSGAPGGGGRPPHDPGDYAALRVRATAGQRAASAHHAEQHHRGVSRPERADHHGLRGKHPAIEKIIASLDQPPAGEPLIVTLKYASALDLVPLVNRLLGAEASTAPAAGGAAEQQRVTLVADPRSNSVMMRSDNPARAARVKALIEQLDTPGRPGGNMFIVYLKNAEAARVAQTLRALMSGGSDVTTGPSAPSAIGNQLSMNSGAQPQPAAQPAPAPTTSSNPFTGGSAGSGGGLPGGLTIQADTANNALIIMGPEPLYNNLRAIIDRLDVRRAQVFVEALIVEVATERMAEFGIQWQILQGINKNNVQGFGGTNFGTPGNPSNNIISGSTQPRRRGQGLNAGILNGTVTIPGLGTITNLAFLAACARAGGGRQHPLHTYAPDTRQRGSAHHRRPKRADRHRLVRDHGRHADRAAVHDLRAEGHRRPAAREPQITEGGTIRLLVYQESRASSRSHTTTGLVLSKRALESSVVVDDQQVAVLGGLIQDSFTDGSDRVPISATFR
jgi:general secretion pathway protein D